MFSSESAEVLTIVRYSWAMMIPCVVFSFVIERAKTWQARDDRVDIIDKKTEDHGMLAITSIYVKYLLPMMLEIQYWDYKNEEATP